MLLTLDALGGCIEPLSDTSSEQSWVQASTEVGNTAPTQLQLNAPNGSALTEGQLVEISSSNLKLQIKAYDSNDKLLKKPPRVSWIISSTDPHARGSVRLSGGTATLSFNRAADYLITAKSGSWTLRFAVRFDPNSVAVLAVQLAGNGQRVADNGLIGLTSVSQGFTVQGLNKAGKIVALNNPIVWSVESSPTGGTASFQSTGAQTLVSFDRAGLYTLRATSGSVTSRVRVNVVAVLTSLTLEASANQATAGESLQFSATARDQFQRPLSSQPKFSWTASGGSISSTGTFQAGATPGTFQVTVKTGQLSASRLLTIAAATPPTAHEVPGLNDPALRGLVTSYYVDGSINRDEMIQILRSVGADNIVTATELADLRLLVSANSPVNMPEYVRSLANNVVNSNPANLKFRGQAAGNLQAGSHATLLNNLVDKWFLGADLPALTHAGLSYQYAVGPLFSGNPLLTDSRQGILGDCYFLASLVSIADANPDAIRDMFIDNGDGTYTVRFYAGALGLFWQGGLISAGFLAGSGVADYVTVDRHLAVFSSGVLAYSGYGRSAVNPATPLWLALAEKAYAQWNETGKAGRNGTNTFAGIEGGWMSNVNAQVLGYNSTHYPTSSSAKLTLIQALASGQAVTIGTPPSASLGGVVGSHAYVVTGYNSATDTFTLYNTWSSHHPTPLSWAQLQSQTSAFVVTSPAGSSSAWSTSVWAGIAALPVSPGQAAPPAASGNLVAIDQPASEVVDAVLGRLDSLAADELEPLAPGYSSSANQPQSGWLEPGHADSEFALIEQLTDLACQLQLLELSRI